MSASPQKRFIGELSPKFAKADFKYRRADSEFRRILSDGDVTAVGVGLLKASKPGYFKVASSAHVRIGILEDLYLPFHPYVPPSARRDHHTLSVNCDGLFRDKSVAQSFELVCDEAVVALADKFWVAVVDDILPFLERYSRREDLVWNLMLGDFRERVTSDLLTRYCVLLSDRVLARDLAGFDTYAAQFLEECRKPAGRMYLEAANAIVAGMRAQARSGELGAHT